MLSRGKSISVVEAAWFKGAQYIHEDPGYIVAATHGKHGVIKEHEMDNEVIMFGYCL